MEPLTAIIGLLITFINEKHRQSSSKDLDFVKWLSEHNHQDLAQLIKSQNNLLGAIQSFEEQHFESMGELNQKLDSLLGNQTIFKDISTSINNKPPLSDQAIQLIKDFYNSGASSFLIIKCLSEPIELMLLGDQARGRLSYSDERFLEADLKELAQLDLLDQDFNGGGDTLYRITRTTQAFVEGLT
jgi:hypothetical protein